MASHRRMRFFLGSFLNLKFSAPPLRSLRLSGECSHGKIHRRDAEDAETAQRRPEIRKPHLFLGVG